MALQDLTTTVRVSKDGAFLELVDVLVQGVCSSPFLFVLATELWAIKIWEHTGIIGIQVNCGVTGFWNGAACVRLVLRNRVHLGVSHFLFKVRPPFVREKKTTVFKERISVADSCPLARSRSTFL